MDHSARYCIPSSRSSKPAGRSPSPPPLCGVGGGGVHPSAPIQARTAASDGQRASTRAARSAGLRFAVIPLSKALDRENKVRRLCWHLIHRKRSPFPSVGEGLNAAKSGRDLQCWARHFHLAASEALPRCPAGRSPSPGGVALEGFTPPHHLYRGQRLPTDTVHSPAPRTAPGSGSR